MENGILRVGILGPGNIVRRVRSDFDRATGVQVTAVASRDEARARAAAELYAAPQAYSSYEALCASPHVDMVYIATPHPMHFPHAMMAMRHGKQVLVEKPMALNDREVRALRDCAREMGVFLMEAFWTRFFPASLKMAELVKGGAIGQVRHVAADFSSAMEIGSTGRLFERALAGGSLMDIGVYTLQAATQFLGTNPSRIDGACELGPTGVDIHEAVTLQYPSGATAQLMSGFRAMGESRLAIYGSEGLIIAPDFWRPTRLTLCAKGRAPEEFCFEPENEGFYHEFVHARQMILEGKLESPIMPLQESEGIARIAAALRGQWGVIYPGEEEYFGKA